MIAEAVLSRAQNPRLPPPVALTWCQRALELYNTPPSVLCRVSVRKSTSARCGCYSDMVWSGVQVRSASCDAGVC
eukprot:783369-Rhodomonas_salina.4